MAPGKKRESYEVGLPSSVVANREFYFTSGLFSLLSVQPVMTAKFGFVF